MVDVASKRFLRQAERRIRGSLWDHHAQPDTPHYHRARVLPKYRIGTRQARQKKDSRPLEKRCPPSFLRVFRGQVEIRSL